MSILRLFFCGVQFPACDPDTYKPIGGNTSQTVKMCSYLCNVFINRCPAVSIFKNIYGSSWLFMIIHEYLWIFMNICEYLWIFEGDGHVQCLLQFIIRFELLVSGEYSYRLCVYSWAVNSYRLGLKFILKFKNLFIFLEIY